jgi:hypothetical protein
MTFSGFFTKAKVLMVSINRILLIVIPRLACRAAAILTSKALAAEVGEGWIAESSIL